MKDKEVSGSLESDYPIELVRLILAGFQHDLANRTSHARVRLFQLSELLKHDDALRDLAEQAGSDLDRLNTILDGVDLAVQRSFLPTVLDVAVTEVVDECRNELPPGVSIRTALGAPDCVVTQLGLHQILHELVMNAAGVLNRSAGASRAETIKVSTAFLAGSTTAIVTIEDDGPGIAAADMPHIFERGFSTRPHSRGMGLWLCRGLVGASGGDLSLHPSASGGIKAVLEVMAG